MSKAGKRKAKAARRAVQEAQRKVNLQIGKLFPGAAGAGGLAANPGAVQAAPAAATAAVSNDFLAGLGGRATGEVVEEAAKGGGRLSKIKNLASGGGLATAGMTIIGTLLVDQILSSINQSRGSQLADELAHRELDIQEQATDADNVLIEALLPSSQQARSQAMAALLAQLTDGNIRPQVARGEIFT